MFAWNHTLSTHIYVLYQIKCWVEFRFKLIFLWNRNYWKVCWVTLVFNLDIDPHDMFTPMNNNYYYLVWTQNYEQNLISDIIDWGLNAKPSGFWLKNYYKIMTIILFKISW
jgi:hypothetical protein